MPPAYKRQHYLPAAYLKYFSIDQAKCGRDSWIWRFDGQTKCLVRVDSQCARNFHYSEEKAADVEKMFSVREGQYCACIDKIKNGRPLTDQEGGVLLTNMFDFYIRNIVHKNDTGAEGVESYRRCWDMFASQILLKGPEGISKTRLLEHISKYWGLELVATPAGRVIITSDNPSVWTSVHATRPGLHLLTLPITPTQVAVAYDRRFVLNASKEMTEDDYLTLMDSQMHNAVSSAYSCIDISDENLKLMRERFAEKDRLECRVNETSWTLAMAVILPRYRLSFLELPPPLM